jgi:beta-lactamase regulating signal transducer with metallopeptidase domain
MPAELARLIRSSQLEGRVTLVDDRAVYAFAAGLARPHIWLSSGLLALLDEAELAAVLCHERHHLRRRDPLRVLLARSLAHGLFFLPAAAGLRNLYLEAKEREADAASGANYDLAAALLKLVQAGAHLPAGASLAAASLSATAGRIQRLLGVETPSGVLDRAMIQRLAASLALVAALWITSTVSLSRAASPPAGGECGYTTGPAAAESFSTPANFTSLDVAPRR